MRFLTNILAKAGLIVDGTTQLNTIANATIDTDKFLVSDGGVIKYRTGAELVSDLGSLTASTLKHQVKLSEAIAKGQAVYVSSADGTNMIVSKASNTTDLTSSKTLGLLETGGALNAQVNVVTEGLLAGLDTSTANAGDPVWLGTNGNLIFGLVNKPSAPAHLVFIGIVTRVQSNNGEIFVKVQNGFELEELHNVAISSIANKNLLMYEAATSLWKNKTLGTVIGGSSTQYVKGDGTLGSFPDIGGGGGMVYYLNGSIASGVAGYSQMSRTPVLGTGTDFSKTGNGLICQFLTDANDPSLLSVPSGAWRFGLYASMATAGNSSKFYVEVYKYDGTTFTLIGTSSATPESVSNGTAVEYYTTTVAMATAALSVTDRIAVRVYATDNNTRTMTIHTENSHLCDIATTFPTGISAINGLITPSQYLSTTTTGTDFTISSSSNTHYFNLPVASATVTGKLSSTDWSTFNNKQNALGYTPVNQTRTLTINGVSYDLTSDRTWSVGTVTSVGVSVPTGLTVSNSPVISSGTIAIAFTAGYSIPTTASQSNWDTAYNNRITSLTTTGTSGAATLVSNVLNIPQYQAQGSYITSLTGEATASGPGSASVTLTNSAVIGKVLTGLNITGGTVLATDSILTAFGKLQNQVNGLAGGVTYQGTWNASTNSPSLTSSVGTKGYYYVVSVAGSTNLNGITDWKLGDWVIFNGNTWEKVDNTDAVVSVNGFTGAVSLTTTNIAEGTNLYYTDTRARAAISLTTTGSSGAATYSGGVLNVPQYTLAGLGGAPSNRTLTINGTSYDLSADRTWSVGTVTSVSATAGSGISISGSPITSSGTLTITNTGVLSVNGSTGAVTGIITTSNYNSYSPTLTGGGASGTWGISISGNASTTSQRHFSGDISTGGMGRFTGWYNGNAATGLAAEIGISSGEAYIIAYNRQTSSYGVLNLESSAATLRIGGSTVNVVNGSLQQGGNQVLHAGNYNSYAPTLTGGGASGTWGIRVTGFANAGTPRLYASDATYNYDSANPYYMYMTYDGSRWFLQVSPATPSAVRVAYADAAGNADTVDGYHASTSTIGNYIVVRDGNGYIFGNYINMTDDGNPGGGTSISSFITKQGDNYYRSVSPTNAMASIRGVASGSWGINITGTAGSASSVPWTGVSAGARTNYDLRFQPPSDGYSGFQFNTSTGGGAGYFLVRGTSDADVYTAEGITLVADAGWLTLAQRTTASKGVRIMTGTSSTTRASFATDGSINFTGDPIASGSFRAPIFYDSANTSYYLDPNSTTSIRTVGSWRSDSSAWDGEFSGKIQYHANNWYIQGADLLIYRNSGGSNVFNVNQSGNGYFGGSLSIGGQIYINNGDPTIFLQDSNHRSSMIHCNSNVFYILRGSGTNSTGWTTFNGYWPMELNLENNDALFGRNINAPVGTITAGNDMRAPIFYDSNNTGYYGDFASTSRMAYVTMDQSTGAHNHMTYGGYFSGGDWQTLTNTEGKLNVVQVNNINAGGYSNQPPNVYTYGGVLSWRTVNHSFQLYASHTGDITFKTQWNNDNYSGWRRILHESNYNSYSPTLTGGGASGTWGINITGSAGSVEFNNLTSKTGGTGTYQTSGDFRAPIFYDSQDTNYYSDFAGTSKLNTVDTFQVRNIYGVSTDHQFGIFFGNGDGTAYAIYRESGSWTHPYPDLRISFHTGIKLGANANYNGIRFYDDYTMVNQVMSVNNASDGLGANNVYVNNSLQAGSSLRAPIFYDSNDTTYYADFANSGTSIYTAGIIRSSGVQVKGSSGGGQIYPTMSNGGVSLYGGNSFTNGAYFTVTGIDYASSPGAGSAEFVIRSTASSKFALFSYNGSTWTGRYGLFGSTGNVTIGDANTDIGYRLYVIGDIYATGNVIAYSDARVKTNIREIENPLARVLNTRGVMYDRTDNEEKDSVGFIAQELEKEFPELISTSTDGRKGVKYQNMVAVLIEAMKEQNKEIQKLKMLINGASR